MRASIVWLAGAIASALSFGFAAFVGSGAGHGTDLPALITIAPFSLFSNPLEENGLTPFLAFAYWGTLFRLAWRGGSRGEVYAAATLLGAHVASALAFIQEGPMRWFVIPLMPHLLLVVATTLAIILRWRSVT